MRIFCLILFSIFFQCSYSFNYNEIKKTFIDYSSQYKKIIDLDINNIEKPDKESLINIDKELKEYNLVNWFLKQNNNRMVTNINKDTSLFSYSNDLYPNKMMDNHFVMMLFFFTYNDALKISKKDLINLNKLIYSVNIGINEKYIADFMFVHELTHLIKYQNKLPNGINFNNIWVDNYYYHYQEMHSDLFSVIYLHNFLNYSLDEINNILNFRRFNLFYNDDFYHYSNPFIKKLLKEKTTWVNLKDFDEINDYISNIYISVSKEQEIGKYLFNDDKIYTKNICLKLIKNYKPAFESYYSVLLLNKCKQVLK